METSIQLTLTIDSEHYYDIQVQTTVTYYIFIGSDHVREIDADKFYEKVTKALLFIKGKFKMLTLDVTINQNYRYSETLSGYRIIPNYLNKYEHSNFSLVDNRYHFEPMKGKLSEAIIKASYNAVGIANQVYNERYKK